MSRSIRRLRLALPVPLIALGTATALAVPAQAASSWSPPVQLPAGCASSGSQPVLAVNAAGTEAAAGSQLNADNSSSVLVCTSAGGQTWPAPATVGQGTTPPWRSPRTADSGTILGCFAAPVKVGLPPYPGGRTRVALDDAGQAVMVWARGLGAANVAATRSAAGTWSAAAQRHRRPVHDPRRD